MIEGVPLGTHFAHLALAAPDAVAVVAPDGIRTRDELNRRANRLAHALAARGVGVGDFVTFALRNSAGFVETCIACWKLGAIPQPVSPKIPEPELKAILDLAKPAAVVVEEDAPAQGLGETIDALTRTIFDEREPPEAVSPHLKAPTSGGSTGKPKLIVSEKQGRFDPGAGLLFRTDESDVAVMPAPLYHNGPLSAAFGALMAGGRLVLMPKFDPEATLAAVADNRATWLYLVPTMMSRIWRLPDEVRTAYDISTLRTLWHMAAPCPAWLKEAWMDWIGAEKVFELYGGTEAQATTIINGVDWLAHRGSVGKPIVGEMRVFGPDGEPLPPGEVGEIYLRVTPGTPQTYHYIGAEARRLGDWESLGDMGRIDEEGYVYIADRRADMILVGGANVYPAEVEAALEEHPLVVSCAVIGLPDDDLGNLVHAVVQARAGLDIEALQAHLAQRLSPAKRPRSYELVDHPVRDDAGKVRRFLLRQDRLAAAPAISQP